MNNSPHHHKHQRNKAIRTAQKDETYQTDNKGLSEKQKKTYLSSPENLKTSKARTASKKKHDQTTPGEVTWETEPESIHVEGKQWIKATQKQILEKAKRIHQKLQKFGLFKGKK